MINKFAIILLLFAYFAVAPHVQAQMKKCAPSETSYNLLCMKQELLLVDSKITVRVFTKTKPGMMIDRTFIVIHNSEQKGLDAAKQVIAENYGRVVEVVSNSPVEENKRYLYFGTDKANCVDPNRIYTPLGIVKTLHDYKNEKPCQKIESPSPKIISGIAKFAADLLGIITLSDTQKFVIGVHNNKDSLSLNVWSEVGDEAKSVFGIFKANNHITNKFYETDKHNFVLTTNGSLFGQLLANGIYFAALQENRKFLTEVDPITNRTIIKQLLDDGSMSIFFGTKLYGKPGKLISYMNIEAGGYDNLEGENKEWQKKVIKLAINKIKL